jgi:protein-L-isoaspartate(D-aspartate) O-methyltransferase
LHVKKGDKILEIGTGSGYQAAVLLAMGANVYSIERIEKLSLKAQKMLTFLGYKPILTCGDGTNGWALHAPYDKIIVTAGAPIIPEILKQQLKIGGILVIPVGNLQKQKMITVVRKGPTDFEEIELSDFAFVPLLGEQGWK